MMFLEVGKEHTASLKLTIFNFLLCNAFFFFFFKVEWRKRVKSQKSVKVNFKQLVVYSAFGSRIFWFVSQQLWILPLTAEDLQ